MEKIIRNIKREDEKEIRGDEKENRKSLKIKLKKVDINGFT